VKTFFWKTHHYQRRAWTGLFLPNRIGVGLGFSAGPDRSRIVMSKACQLKYTMSYVRTPLSCSHTQWKLQSWEQPGFC